MQYPQRRNAYGPSFPTNSGRGSFESFLFVEDGVLVEPDAGRGYEMR